VNVHLGLRLTCHLLSAFCYGRLCLYQSQEGALLSPSPTGFVCLEFSWPRAPFFSSMQSYLPVTIAVFFLLFRVHVEMCPSPTLQWSVLALATFTSLPLSKHIGWGVLLLLPSPASLFIHSLSGDCSSPTLQSSGCPTLFAKCLFFSATCLLFRLFFFLFFPCVGVSLSRGLC
jgi:hypothetical protein